VAIVAGTLLPYLNARDRRLLKPTNHKDASQIDEDGSGEEEDDVEMDKVREMVREWKAEAARHGRPLKLPTSESLSHYMSTQLNVSAIHATQYLDCRIGAVWPDHGVDLLHHQSLAGERQNSGKSSS